MCPGPTGSGFLADARARLCRRQLTSDPAPWRGGLERTCLTSSCSLTASCKRLPQTHPLRLKDPIQLFLRRAAVYCRRISPLLLGTAAHVGLLVGRNGKKVSTGSARWSLARFPLAPCLLPSTPALVSHQLLKLRVCSHVHGLA